MGEGKVFLLLGWLVVLPPAHLGAHQWLRWDVPCGVGKGKPGEMLIFTAQTGWGGGVAQLFSNYLSLGHNA